MLDFVRILGSWLHLRRAVVLLSMIICWAAQLEPVSHAQCTDPDPSIRFVRATGGSDLYSGECWEEAFGTLGKALAVLNDGGSEVTEIRIAGGTYKPSGISFLISKPCTIRGGYEGNPQNPGSWNPAAYETILSGDISENDTSSSSTWTDNAHHVLEAWDFGAAGELHIESLTIERGTAALASVDQRFGGGILVHELSELVDVFVENCRFRHNRAMAGGGAIACWTNSFYVVPPDPTPEPWLDSIPSPLHVRDCVFEFNELISPPDCSLCVNLPEFGGGAIFCDADLRVSLSTFRSNGSHTSVSPKGGAILLWPPAELLRVVNSSFIDNEVVTESIAPARGGAICAFSAEEDIHMTVDVTGCLLARNRAIGNNGTGGAIDMANLEGLLLVRDSTIVGNEAEDLAGGIITFSDATITNSILYRNTSNSTTSSTLEDQLWYPVSQDPEEDPPLEISISHSCVEGITPGEDDGNIADEPYFVNEPHDDYRLKLGLPISGGQGFDVSRMSSPRTLRG